MALIVGIIGGSIVTGSASALASSVAAATGADPSKTEPAATSARGFADCTYRVKHKTGLYEWPSNARRLHHRKNFLGYKHRGDRVRGYSNLTYYNRSEHRWYRAVDTSKAHVDHIGWIYASQLRLIHC